MTARSLTYDLNAITKLKKEYCAANLLAKIKKEDIDTDPFIKKQDADSADIKTLLITNEPEKEYSYIVSYVEGYSN